MAGTRPVNKKPSLEEVPDEGEPKLPQTESVRRLSLSAIVRRAARQRFSRFKNRVANRLGVTPFGKTPAGPSQALMLSALPAEPRAPRMVPVPCRVAGGVRTGAADHRFPVRLYSVPSGPINPDDIKELSAASFNWLAETHKLRVIRTTRANMEEGIKRMMEEDEAEEEGGVLDPGSVSDSLTEDMIKEVLLGQGQKYKRFFGSNYHRWIDGLAGKGDAVTLRAVKVANSVQINGTSDDFPRCEEAINEYFEANGISISKITSEDVTKFHEKADKPPKTDAQIQAKLPKQHWHHTSTFRQEGAEILPPNRSYDLKLELRPGATPPASRGRAFNPDELSVIKKWIDDNLKKKFIRPSQSEASAPVLLVRKPGGGVRVCVDYRGINNVTLKSRYPLPLIKETLDAICRAKIFTKLDVIAAFNRIRVKQGHEWLTAFITRFGLFESLVVPFGLQGAPGAFQNYINDILHDVLDVYATAYLDDVLIYSDNIQDHERHVNDVLDRLAKAGLSVDIDKCEFYTTRTKYLGLIITPGGIEMDPEKVKAVTEWQAPESKKSLQSFLGFANFYRRFIKNFSTMATPLYELTKKDAVWTWTDIHQRAFESLKKAFTEGPVLKIYDWTKKTVVETDASNWAAGGTLSQYGDDGTLYPVAYFSAKHTSQECNYDVYDKELLAIIKALEEWRPELEGAQQPFDILTDHKNLQTFTTNKRLTQRHMRWSQFLSRFNFLIKYTPGSKNLRPDALSRKPNDRPDGEEDNRLVARKRALLDPLWFEEGCLESEDPAASFSLCLLGQEDLDTKSTDDLIRTSYETSVFLQELVSCLTDESCRQWPPTIRKVFHRAFSECHAVNGVAKWRNRVIIDPHDKNLQLQLISRQHNSPGAGHPGRDITYELLQRDFYWEGMYNDVRLFCRGCLPCAKTKSLKRGSAGYLKPVAVALAPWTAISVDYVTPLPESTHLGQTFKHVAVVVDRLTKMRHYIATMTLEAEELADRFIDRVYSIHGLPDSILSDRGTQFVSRFWSTLCKRLSVIRKLTSAFHPQTNAQTERVNAEMEQFLRLYINWAQTDWAKWLPLAEFAGNNAVSSTTGISPFFANYGHHPRMGTEPRTPPPPDLSPAQLREHYKANELADRFQKIWDFAVQQSRRTQERYEDNANKKRVDSLKYRVGDMVLLNTTNLANGRPHAKFSPRWEGPFKVTRAESHTVHLALPTNMKCSPVFHVSMVQPWSGKGLPGQNTSSDVRANDGRVMIRTDNQEEHEEWAFEKFIDCAQLGGNSHWHYHVKWKTGNPTWEPVSNVIDCEHRLQQFHHENPDKPVPPEVQSLLHRLASDSPAPASALEPAPKPPRRRSARLQRETASVIDMTRPFPDTVTAAKTDTTVSKEVEDKLCLVFGKVIRRLMDIWSGKLAPTQFVDYDGMDLER